MRTHCCLASALLVQHRHHLQALSNHHHAHAVDNFNLQIVYFAAAERVPQFSANFLVFALVHSFESLQDHVKLVTCAFHFLARLSTSFA